MAWPEVKGLRLINYDPLMAGATLWEMRSPGPKHYVCTYVGGTEKNLTTFQDNCQHEPLLPSTPSLYLGFSLPRSPVASTALFPSMQTSLGRSAFWEQGTKQRLLISFYSNQVYIFLLITIYRVYSESFCINSNFKHELDINDFYIWDTISFEESV